MQNPETNKDLDIHSLSEPVVVYMRGVQCRNRRYGSFIYNDKVKILENVPPENVTFQAQLNTLVITTNKLGLISAYEAEPKGKTLMMNHE